MHNVYFLDIFLFLSLPLIKKQKNNTNIPPPSMFVHYSIPDIQQLKYLQ